LEIGPLLAASAELKAWTEQKQRAHVRWRLRADTD
jgi:hypothetical protein